MRRLLGAFALAAAGTAFFVTARAAFPAHPGWLAVQKADVILGPIGVGLYVRARRPGSRFGNMLIGLGFVGAFLMLQGIDSPWPYSLGVAGDAAWYVALLAVVLAFPSGRLQGAATWGLLGLASLVGATYVFNIVLTEQIRSFGSISECSGPCPGNALLIASKPELAAHVVVWVQRGAVSVAVLTICFLAWRFHTSTRPGRRALLVGQSVAIVYYTVNAAYWAAALRGWGSTRVHETLAWALVITRASVWYGFLAAFIVAELFAARVLRRMIRESLRRPSYPELEALLRVPLDDPSLRLAFWHPELERWIGVRGDDVALEPLEDGRLVTRVDQGDEPAVAISHDRQLADEPELLQAAGATALLARENALLDAERAESVAELGLSRQRIATARDVERRRIEQDLHDGAQQSLIALGIRIAEVTRGADVDSGLRLELQALEQDLDQALDELRDLAHGIYPSILAALGLVPALRAIAQRAELTVQLTHSNLRRYTPEVEAAVYFSCSEAIQNAIRHGGEGTTVSVALSHDGEDLRFVIEDTGCGFSIDTTPEGMGLAGMHDRIDAVQGRLEVTSLLGGGTRVSGSVSARPLPAV